MIKAAPTAYPIHALLKSRWSPRAFTGEQIAADVQDRIFEAARWSPSANNLQPWAFVIDDNQSETFQRTLGFLKSTNFIWGRNAPLIGIAFAKTIREDGKINPHALYDLGQAVAHLTLQVSHEGLFMHQVAGFSPDDVRGQLSIPSNWQPVTMFVIGHLGDASILPDELATRERAPRVRKPISEFVFRKYWEAKA